LGAEGTPTRHEISQRGGVDTVPPSASRFRALRPRAAGMPQSIFSVQAGYPSACGDILGREKGAQGQPRRPFAFALVGAAGSAPLLAEVGPQRGGDAISSSLLKTAAERADDRDQDASSDEAGNQITDPTAAERDAKRAKQPTRDSGPYDAEHNVHQKAHLAFYELLGEPAADTAKDDGCDPTDLLLGETECRK
jgi:hypothetical protein